MFITKKEIKILKLKKKGFSQGQIAKKLNISQPAVSIFEGSVKRKLREALDDLGKIEKIGFRFDKNMKELIEI